MEAGEAQKKEKGKAHAEQRHARQLRDVVGNGDEFSMEKLRRARGV